MPENPFGPKPRQRTLQDALIDAHGRNSERRQRGGQSPLTYGQFVDQFARELDQRGEGSKARAIRDLREQKRIAGRESDLLGQRLADVNADGGGGSALGGALRKLNPFAGGSSVGSSKKGGKRRGAERGDRSLEEVIQQDSGTSKVQDAARLALLGGERFADVASLGGARALKGMVAETVRPDLAGLAGDKDPSDLLRGTGGEIMDRGDQALREMNAAQGVNEHLAAGVEKAGEIVGLLTPAGYVSKLGNVLKVTQAGRVGLPFLGRLLQNPIVNMVAAEGLISEGEIQTAKLMGEGDRATALREGQSARLVNAGVMGLFQKPLQLFGRAAERGLLRLTTGAPQRASMVGQTIAQAPNLWAKAMAAGAHVTGKAAEFQLFGLVPQVYRPGPDGKSELSPWVTTILNPAAIADAVTGKNRKWQEAVGEVFAHVAQTWQQEGVAGALVGALGLKHARIGGADRAKDVQGPFSLGSRRVDPATEAREIRRMQLEVERAGRAALTPAARKAMREALDHEIDAIIDKPDALQAVVDYVAAASEMQARLLKERGFLPKDTPSVVKHIRAWVEHELGPDLFAGPAKSQEPGLGVPVEMVGDPSQPGQPGRKGEILERIHGSLPTIQLPGTSPNQQVRRPIELARVRWEDGTLGIVPMDRLILPEAPQGSQAGQGGAGAGAPPAGPAGAGGPPAGGGGAPPAGGGPPPGFGPDAPVRGTFGQVKVRGVDLQAELVRGYIDEKGQRMVDVRSQGRIFSVPAEAWQPVLPETTPQRRRGDPGRVPANETPAERRARRERELRHGRKRQVEELEERRLAEATDPRTGLVVARRAEDLIRSHEAKGGTVLYGDADNLKGFNTAGMEAGLGTQAGGDAAIEHLGRTILEAAKGHPDVEVIRLGRRDRDAQRPGALRLNEKGDEFVVLAKTPEGAARFQKLVDERLAGSKFKIGDKEHSVAASWGVGKTFTEANKAGDAAKKERKEAGRIEEVPEKDRRMLVDATDPSIYQQMLSGPQLRGLASSRGLPTTGKPEELAGRLAAFVQHRQKVLRFSKPGVHREFNKAELEEIHSSIGSPIKAWGDLPHKEKAQALHDLFSAEVLKKPGERVTPPTPPPAPPTPAPDARSVTSRAASRAAELVSQGKDWRAIISKEFPTLGIKDLDWIGVWLEDVANKGKQPTSPEANAKRVAALKETLAKLQATYEKKMKRDDPLVPPSIKASALKSLAARMSKIEKEIQELEGAKPPAAPPTPPPTKTPPPPPKGTTYEADVFQGRGATPEEVYGPENVARGRAHPLLGPGDYYATTQADAEPYAGKAGKVTPHRVRLENPLRIDSSLAWRDLLAQAKATELDTSSPAKGDVLEATKRLQAYIRSKGHDGVVVEIPTDADVNARGESIKRLREAFGHSQVVRFGKAQESNPPPSKTPPPGKPTGEGELDPQAKAALEKEGAHEVGGHVVVTGKRVEIRQEGTPERVTARYALVPLDSVMPSHDPGQGFKATEGYPAGLQPRDYAGDKAEQAKVQDLISRFDPGEVVAGTPRADQGPPSVAYDTTSKRFVVLNGNGRAMSLKEVLKDPEWARRYLGDIDYEALGLAKPTMGSGDVKPQMLVRLVELDARGKAAFEFARRGNIPAGLRQKPMDRAAAEADLLSDDILKDLATEPDSTLSEAVKGPRGKSFRDLLRKKLGKAGNDLFQEDGTLTESGEEFVEGMLLVKSGLDRDLLGKLEKGTRRTIAASTMQLAQLQRDPALKPYGEAFVEGLRYVQEHLEGGKLTFDEYLNQGQMFGEVKQPTLTERVMGEFIRRERSSPRKMRDALAELIKDAQETGPGTLADAGLTPLERMAEVLKVQVGSSVGGVDAERRDPVKGLPDPEDPSRRAELPFEWREEDARIPDPIAGEKGYPIGGLTMPMSATPTPTWRGQPVNQRTIIDRISEVFGRPIRIGRSKSFRSGRVIGFYSEGPGYVGPRVIRLKSAEHVVGATHEAGHTLERTLFPEMMRDTSWRQMQQELLAAGKALYPRKPWNGWESEGLAEFMRLYLTQPQLMKQHFPHVEKWFDRHFMASDKAFHEGLAEVREMAAAFGDQGAYNRILANVVRERIAPSKFEKALGFFSKEKWWDQLTPIERLVQEHQKLGGHLDPHQNPFVLGNALRMTHSARAQFMATKGMIDPAGNIVGPSLNDAADVVRGVAKKSGMSYDEAMERFRVYLVAMRTIDLYRRGLGPPNIDINDALQEAKRLETEAPEFRKAGQLVWEWNRGVLTYMRSLGAITEADYHRVLQRSKFYIPFQRVLPDAVGGSPLAAKGTGLSRGLRSIGISGREIKDPFPVMVAQAAALIRLAHQRAIMHRIADLGRQGSPVFKAGLGEWIEKVDPDVVKRLGPIDKFREKLEKAGVDLKDVDLAELLTWYEPKMQPDSKDPIMPVRNERGEIEWYQVKRELWDATQALDVYRLPGAFDLVFGVPARLKRLGTTGLRASFSLVTNPLRDLTTMLLQSREKNPAKILKAWAKQQAAAIPAIFGKDSYYRGLWKRLGGEMAQPLGADSSRAQRLGENLGRSRMGATVADLKKGRVLSAAGDFIDLARDVLQAFEAGPRAAEMQMVVEHMKKQGKMEQGWKPGDPLTLDQSLELLTAGKQVTVDFSAAGRYAKMVNAAVPFFNVAIQGPRAFARAWARNPLATTMLGMSVAAATLALWNKNKDEEWYKDLPDEEKHRYWHIEVDGQRVRIPRPPLIGDLFGTAWEASFDAMYREDPKTVKEALGVAYDNLVPDGRPVLPGEFIEQVSGDGGWDSYRKAPIVPRAEQGRPAEEQYGSSTTVAARKLGQLFGWSPRRIDHAIEGIFGGVGRDVARRAGGLVEEKERESQPSDLWVVGRLFAMDGVDGNTSKAVEDFFELRANLEERGESKDRPATPQERAALRVAERQAKRLKILRDRRAKATTAEERREFHQQMREAARQATEQIEKLLLR